MATALDTHIVNRRVPLLSEQSKRVFLSFLSLVLLIFVRRPDLLRWPTLVVEDATIFYTQQVIRGISAIFTPYNGYLHLVPRLIAFLGSIVPTSWAAIVFVESSVLIAAASGAIFSLDCYRALVKSDFLRFLLPVVVYSATLIGSHMGNVTSLLWFLLPVAFLMLIVPVGVANAMSRRTAIAMASIAALISLTQPMCLLLAPYTLWRLKGFRGWSRLIPLVLLAGTIIENAVFFVVTPYVHRDVHPFELLHQALVAIGNRVVLSSFVGFTIAEHMECDARTATVALISACIVMAAVLLLKRHSHGVLILGSSLYLVFVSVAITLNSRLDGNQFQSLCNTTNWESERYFLVGNMVLLSLLVLLLDTFPRPKLESSFLLLGLLTLALVNNFPIGRTHYNSHWRWHAKEINAWLAARRECKPAAETSVLGYPGWMVVLPELRGCHGETALDGLILTDNAGHNYLADHGWKRLIPDEQTLKLLGVSRTQTMSASQLRQVPTAEPLPVVRNKTVVNAVTGEVFLLKSGRRHYLQTPASMAALGLGAPFTMLSEYASAAIPLGHMLDQISNPAPIQIKNGPTYLLYSGILHQIPDLQTRSNLGFRSSPTVFDEEDLSFLRRGDAIPPLHSNAVQNQGNSAVYLLEGGMRRYVPDPPTLATLHLQSSVQALPPSMVNEIPEAAPIPSVTSAVAK